MKKNINIHLKIFAAVFILIFGAAAVSALVKGDMFALIRSGQPTNAACNTSAFSVQSPNGFTFQKGCLSLNSQIYSDDQRFTFSQFPQGIDGLAYVKTQNVPLKGRTSLTWSVTTSSPTTVYLLYRRITGQSVPSWIASNYTKLSSNSVDSLNSFVVRKNLSGSQGVYDVYKINNDVKGTITFGAPSTSQQIASSMYIVALDIHAAPTPVVTARPTATVRPSGSAIATARPTASGTSRPSATGTSRPTATATTRPTASGTTSPTRSPNTSALYPAQVLDLRNWKVTLPIGAPGKPTEIKQPALATYKHDQWFTVSNGGVRFRAHVSGVTTENSPNVRSELRERTNNGTADAAWSSNSGKHTMFVDQMVTRLPTGSKPHMVVGQIHGGGDDVTVFRLENRSLWLTKGDETHGYLITNNFELNKRFTIMFEVQNNVTRYYYNGALVNYTHQENFSGAYFKAGAYIQENCKSGADICAESNYGEVIIYDLKVTHQ